MVAEAIDIDRETYFCILMDRAYNGPVIVCSPDGGIDIEEVTLDHLCAPDVTSVTFLIFFFQVAEKTPDRIKKIPVDIKTGVSDDLALEVADFLGFAGDLKNQCAEQVRNRLCSPGER